MNNGAPDSPDFFPLTRRQTLMWMDHRLHPHLPYHNVAHTIRLGGPLDRARLAAAYRSAVAEIDQLRLQIDPGTPRQRVLPDIDAAARLEEVDLRARPESLDDWIGKRVAKPFDFSRPPIDVALVALGPEDHLFYLGQHHIVTDGFSFLNIADHMADHYAGRPTRARAPFRDYVTLEAAYQASPRAAKAGKFWEKKLAGGVPPLRYYGRARRERSLAVERMPLPLGVERTQRLARVAESPELKLLGPEFSRLVALNTVIFAFLHRTTGNRELAIGTPIANRSHALASVCGLVMEQMFLKVEIDGDETFGSLARKVRADMAASLTHGQYCVSDRGLDFSFLNPIKHTPKQFGELRTQVDFQESWAYPSASRDIPEGESRNGFSVHIHEFPPGDELVLKLDFHKGTFDPALRAAARAHFLRLVDAFLADLGTRIALVDLLDGGERGRLLQEGHVGGPEASAPDLVEVIAGQAARSGDDLAVISSAERLTYRDLEQRSSSLAGKLQSIGIAPGSRVAVCLPRGADELLTMLATLKAGATYVPIDAGHPPERIQMILEDAGPEVVVTHRALLPVVGGESPPSGAPTRLLLDEAWAASDAWPPARPVPADADRLAYILFTSGSTGRPKGVEVGRHAFSNFLRSMAHTPGMSRGDRLLAITTTTFDISGLELFLPLWVGATVDIVDREATQDPRLLRRRLEDDAVTVLQATPATWRLLIEAGWQGGRPLKMLCGGEALSPALAGQLLERGTELWNMYGPTETTVWSAIKRIEPGFELITIGRPIDNTDIYIVDESLRLVPAGIVGEIVIGGEGLAHGYRGRPDLTAERFVTALPDVPGKRFYRTGDLGRRLDGQEIECLGRVDHQVKIRGFRIELGEIESVLRGVAGVREVLVMARADGPGDPRLIAYWVGPAPHAELAERARAGLPHYMRPTGYVNLEAFPLNTNGKIDRKALPAPTDETLARRGSIDPPRNHRERKLVEIWKALLETESVGIRDNFFDIGGTSLKAVSLMIEIESAFKKTLPLSALLDGPTVEGLAAQLGPTGEAGETTSPLLVLLRDGAPKPPLFFVHDGIGEVLLYRNLALRLNPDRPIYGIRPLSRSECPIAHTRLADMAACYLREIRKVQPQGPYFLAGLCTGGLIALEIARQLRTAGESIGLLTLLDTPHNRARKKSIAKIRLRRFLGLAKGDDEPASNGSSTDSPSTNGSSGNAPAQARRVLTVAGKKISNVVSHESWRLTNEARRTFLVKLLRYYLDRNQPLPPMVQNIAVREVLWIAEREYASPPTFDGPTVLFRATKKSAALQGTVIGGVVVDDTPYIDRFKDPRFGWAQHIPTLTVHDVPGGHSSILMDPNVEVLAQRLQAHLDASGASPGDEIGQVRAVSGSAS
jgi:amino acid adenylation domain-containing protein